MTVSQVGSRIFVAGTTSGIDTAALIDAAVQQRTLRADRLQVEVDENTAKIAAYQELQDLYSNFETALDQLRGRPGFFDDNESVFDLKAGTVATSDGADFSSLVDIAIDTDAIAGTYEIEVTQLAYAHKVIGTSIADQDADLGYAGTFDLGLAGGTTANINIVATDSLAEVAAKINAQSDTTGVTASVIKVSETSYELSLTGTETNKDIEVTGVTGDDVMNLIGVTDGVGGFNNVLQIAQGSIIEFDGVTITRDDNNYDDLAAGLDIDLNAAAPGTIITLEVDNDTASVKDAIVAFIDAYNEIRDFVVANHQVSSDGAVAEDALLFGDNLMDGLANTLSSVLGENFGNGGTIQTIFDLGIKVGNNNKLEISDETKLDNAILNDFDAVKEAFSASFTSDNSEFALLSSEYTGVSILNKAIGVKTDGAGNITQIQVDGNSSLFDFSGSRFWGKEGTAYEGLTFSYVGTATSISMNFSFSQGLSERLINNADPYTDLANGFFVQEKAALQDTNTDKLADAKDIVDKAESYRIAQIEKYAEFETKLAQLEILKRQIRAILGNTDDDN